MDKKSRSLKKNRPIERPSNLGKSIGVALAEALPLLANGPNSGDHDMSWNFVVCRDDLFPNPKQKTDAPNLAS